MRLGEVFPFKYNCKQMFQELSNDSQAMLRAHVLKLLRSGSAHADFERALKDLPVTQRGAKPAGAPYTIWQLVEHLRIAQLDILQFSRDANHKSPKWPDEYWPKMQSPPNEAAWDVSVEHCRRDMEDFEDMIADSANDLLRPIEDAPEGQTLLREALLLADHNSYHIGQIVLMRKLLEQWE